MVAARNIIALTAFREVPQSAKQTARQGKRGSIFLLVSSPIYIEILLHQAIGVYC
jgi:hypothetical protein